MKKLLSLVLAVGLSFGFCFASANGLNKVYADEVGQVVVDEEMYTKDTSYFLFSPQVVLNQETGCYDIDINVQSSNEYFSNFEAQIDFGSPFFSSSDSSSTSSIGIKADLLSAKVTVKQYVKGNAAASLKNGTLRVVFNAPENIKMNDLGGAGYGIKVFTAKTDIKYGDCVASDIEGGCFDIGLWLEDGEVKSAGVMHFDGHRVVVFEECKLEFGSVLCLGDYDFDGTLTINDLIAAQYYLTNDVYFDHDDALNHMLNSVSLQYLQMYLCESISYGEYVASLGNMGDGGHSEIIVGP